MKRHLVVQTLRPVPGLSEATQTTISILQINPSVARAAEKQYFTAAHGRKRDSHDGYISPSPVTPEHSSLWSSAPKAPKSIVAVLQNRAVTICLHRDRGQTQSYVSLPACLFFFCFLFFPFFKKSFFYFSVLKDEWMFRLIDFLFHSAYHDLDTALCSAHILIHVAPASCVACVWTALRQSDLC